MTKNEDQYIQRAGELQPSTHIRPITPLAVDTGFRKISGGKRCYAKTVFWKSRAGPHLRTLARLE